MVIGQDAAQPDPSSQAQGQADVSGCIAGQWQEVERPCPCGACLRPSKEPLWAVHTHDWPGAGRGETDPSEHCLQYGPARVP